MKGSSHIRPGYDCRTLSIQAGRNGGRLNLLFFACRFPTCFQLVNGRLSGFHAPDSFFFRWDIKVKDYFGKPTIGQAAAQRVVEEILRKMEMPATAKWLRNRNPQQVGHPTLPRGVSVPRIWFEWEQSGNGKPSISVSAEVDTAARVVKSISVQDDRDQPPPPPSGLSKANVHHPP